MNERASGAPERVPPLHALALGAVFVLALGAALAALAGARPGNIDDAFVVLVYARSLLAGHGFRYDADQPQVDGFTSLLDLSAKTAALALFPKDGLRVAWSVSLLFYAGTVAAGVLLAARVARSAGRGLFAAALGGLALALAPGLAEGTSYLLETPLYAALVLASVGAFLHGRAGGAVAAGMRASLAFALVLARPEGLVVAPLLCAWRAVVVREESRRARWTAPVALALLLALLAAWRLATFGSLLPNAYHAKTSSVRMNEVRDGLRYVDDFVRGLRAERPILQALAGGALLLQALAGPLLLLAGRWRPGPGRARFLALSALALATLAGVVWSGGDAYHGGRLLVPPFLFALSAALEAHVQLESRERWIPASVLLVVASCGFAATLPGPVARVARALAPRSDGELECSRRIARALRAALPGARLAQHDLQHFKYFAPELPVLDTSGLNHAGIAREPEAGPVRFGRDGALRVAREGIELIHVDYFVERPEAMSDYPAAAVFSDPGVAARFHGEPLLRPELAAALDGAYRTATLSGACGPGWHFNVFVRADLAPELRAAGFTVGER